MKSLVGAPRTLPLVDGTFLYRALAAKDGTRIYVEAASLRDGDATVGAMRSTLILGGALFAFVALAAGWLILGRGLRPVGQMVDMANI